MLPGTTNLTVGASAPGWQGGTYTARVDWPPPPNQAGLLSDLVSRMRAVPLVEFVERTSSGPASVVSPTFRIAGGKFVDLQPYAAGTADDIQPLAGERGFRLYLPGERIWITVRVDAEGLIDHQRIVDVGHDITDSSFRYPPLAPGE